MSSMVACEIGTSAAENIPCTNRNNTICSSVCAAPQAIDATVNPTMHATNNGLRPKRDASHPTGAVMIAAAVIYEVSTQVISSDEADMLPCMYGSATLA